MCVDTVWSAISATGAIGIETALCRRYLGPSSEKKKTIHGVVEKLMVI